jgi:hypothetical protein
VEVAFVFDEILPLRSAMSRTSFGAVLAIVLALVLDANLLLLPSLLLPDASVNTVAALILAMLAFAFVIIVVVSSIAAVRVGLGFVVALVSAAR